MRATPCRRRRAASMSASVGTVPVANAEHLLHDLANGGQRVELAALHFGQEPSQLRVALDRVLEVRLRPRRRDSEHLAGEVLPPPLLEQALVLEVRPMLL